MSAAQICESTFARGPQIDESMGRYALSYCVKFVGIKGILDYVLAGVLEFYFVYVQ